jgi:hypothetical protein
VSVNEDVLKRAIDRQSNATTRPSTQAAEAWLGGNIGVHLGHQIIEVLESFSRDEAATEAQSQAWAGIPILNEWKRLFPDKDPVEVHHRLFQARLLDGAGGKYVWNDRWQTMESTIYGHPGEPKQGPSLMAVLRRFSGDLGLTFENSGLRARAQIEETEP